MVVIAGDFAGGCIGVAGIHVQLVAVDTPCRERIRLTAGAFHEVRRRRSADGAVTGRARDTHNGINRSAGVLDHVVGDDAGRFGGRRVAGRLRAVGIGDRVRAAVHVYVALQHHIDTVLGKHARQLTARGRNGLGLSAFHRPVNRLVHHDDFPRGVRIGKVGL